MAGTGGKASFTERYATLRRATVAYAPPEMLTDDIPDLRALRMSPAIDVYAAASTVYELIAGAAPYEAAPSTSGTSGSRKKTRDIASPYRLKMDTLPDYPIGAHAPGCDLTQLLRREPDVALAAAEQAQQLGLEAGFRGATRCAGVCRCPAVRRGDGLSVQPSKRSSRAGGGRGGALGVL